MARAAKRDLKYQAQDALMSAMQFERVERLFGYDVGSWRRGA